MREGEKKYLELADFVEEVLLRLFEQIKENVLLGVSIFVHESFDRVSDLARIVSDGELLVPISPLLALDEVLVSGKLRLDIRQIGRIAALKDLKKMRNVKSGADQISESILTPGM